MSERWVIDGSSGVLNARAVNINWSDEMGALNYQGPVIRNLDSAMPTQLRWMINPCIGLPSQPFVIWRNRDPGNLSKQELANLPDWEALEIVGLPVDKLWADTPYSLKEQGPLNALIDPFEAALRRLKIGAPPIGWTRFDIGGPPLDDWAAPDVNAYLKLLKESRLLDGVHEMFLKTGNAIEHSLYLHKEKPQSFRMMPRLILDDAVGFANTQDVAQSEWYPLRLFALTAGSDPYAALALGFGTALDISGESDTILMVSVRHQLTPNSSEFELADIVWPFKPLRRPDPPTGLATRLVSHTRPQRLDGPALDSIGVSWNRPLNPAYAIVPPDEPYPVSYVIGRFGPEIWRAEILITSRPPEVGGWMPYVPSLTGDATPMLFPHHLARTATTGDPPITIPDVTGDTITYAVAAQDLFGRWSPWQTVLFNTSTEAAQIPQILSVRLSHEGALTVDFAWDWSDRSPEFIELSGAYADAPSAVVLAARFNFGGNPQPLPSALQIVPLDQGMKPITNWGAAQDKQPGDPGTRYYRLTAQVQLAFNDKPWRDIQVRARGQCRLHNMAIPGGFNISAFGPPAIARALDPKPPPPPGLPEAPQWASLPDAAGVSRAVLSWTAVTGAKGYAVYEATETALLSALDKPSPDTSVLFTTRLATLRSANLGSLRHVFRRVEPALIPQGTGRIFFEATLPRGSRVMHLFAVTAISENNAESVWPNQSKQFAAFATPRLRVPSPPVLEVDLDPAATQPTANLRIEIGDSIPGGRVEIFRAVRDKLAGSVDLMGPPIATLTASAPILTFTDTGITAGWQRIWYRAQSWSAPDPQDGWVEARSPASPPVSVVVVPTTAPTITGIRVNEPGSTETESLVSWVTSAPVPITPLGSHQAVVEARNMDGSLRLRLDGLLDALDHVDNEAALPGPQPANRRIIRVGKTAGYRLFAWLPRPPLGEPFKIELKVIDPLGRIGFGSANVPSPPPPNPIIDFIQPLSGRPGNTFTIHGRNFIARDGHTVSVSLEIVPVPHSPPDPGPLAMHGSTATEIVAVVPEMENEGSFRIIVSRSDGAEAVSANQFRIRPL